MKSNVPGGAYQLPDGSWKDANGKRIAAPRGDVYERPEEVALTAEEVTPGSELLRARMAAIPGEEYEKPEDDLEEGQPEKARRVTKKKS